VSLKVRELDPLLSDDYILIHASASPSELVRTITKPAGDGAMRPVGELVFGTYKHWAHENAAWWHSLDLALHLVNVALLCWLCTRLRLSRYASLVACGLFALHPAHPEAVAWTSSTFDLLAALFSLATLITLTSESRLTWIAAPFLTVLAIFSKESAYALPAIAILTFGGRRKAVFPCVLVAIALFIHCWQVFNGPGGYVDVATGRAQLFSVTPFSTLKTLLYRPWETLLLPIDWAVSPGLALKIMFSLMCVSLCVIAFRSRASQYVHLFFIWSIIASLIPPVHLALIGDDLQGTRVFYLPSIFFCILMSQISRSWAFYGVAIVFSFCALRHNLAIRSEVASLGKQACSAAANAVVHSAGAISVKGLPRSINGIFFFANGFEDCVRSASGNSSATISLTSTTIVLPVLVWRSEMRELQPIGPSMNP